MTHDELLARLNNYIKDCVDNVRTENPEIAKALRAVVELHFRDAKGGCAICSWIINGFVLYEVCPTIKAIEKELL